MKRSKEIHFKQNYNKKQAIIICLLIIFGISFVTIFGRYVLESIENFFTRSKEFYFFSDKLDDDSPVYKIENWSGVDDYDITINMNSYKNNLLKASYNVDYQISYVCSSNIICTLSKQSGTISSSTNTDFFKLTITPNTTLSTGDEVFVEIQVTASQPYQKTLKGRFSLIVGKEKLTYEIVDSANSPYLELNITNTLSYYKVREQFGSYAVGDQISEDEYLSLSEENKQKCYSAIITLEFNPDEVILDMTDTNYLNALEIENTQYNSYNYIKKITFKVEALSSAKVRFYKRDETMDYTYPITNESSIITVTSI